MGSKSVCPVCNSTVTTDPLKSWKFGKYEVNRYKCQKCGSKFNLYQSPTNSYTIPKSK